MQDLGRRGLPLERLLGLVEQPHVLDRDHRLVGERAQDGDVLLAECAGLAPQHRQPADGDAAVHERGIDRRAKAAAETQLAQARIALERDRKIGAGG